MSNVLQNIPARSLSPSRPTDQPIHRANEEGREPSNSQPESKTKYFGMLQLFAGTNSDVDIVAIHGLNGHRKKTWMVDKDFLWLSDLLPFDLPNTRILTYGYDADTCSREYASTQTISRHGIGLAQAISRERSHARRRPIIFLVHGLGGILLKSALNICHAQSLKSTDGLRDVLVSTHGILYFGTPHFGMEIKPIVRFNRLASLWMETANNVVKDLETHSPYLEDVQRLYVHTSEGISTIFFREVYPSSNALDPQKSNVPSESATIPGDRDATTIDLPCNHEGLVKFSKGDNNYGIVLHYLKDYVARAPAAVEQKWAKEDKHRSIEKETFSPEKELKSKDLPVTINYIERKEIQSLMTQKLFPGRHTPHQPRCILHGIGGAGKTQLAANWIREYGHRFSWVILVDASSPVHLQAGLEQWIYSLGPEYREKTWEDAIDHLNRKEKGWLLVFDNADSKDLNLSRYLPCSIHGAIMITTRNQELVGYAPNGGVRVGDLEEDEAVKLLHTVAGTKPLSNATSLKIIRELGRLAVAVVQAGTFIRGTQSFEGFLDTFRTHRDEIMSRPQGIGTEYTYSTYTAFDLSYRDLPPEAQELVKLCAFLHHSYIPVTLFKKSAEFGFVAYTVRNTQPPPPTDQASILGLKKMMGNNWNDVEFQKVVESASCASFINVSRGGSFYYVHPLLQTYIKAQLTEEGRQHYMNMTAQLLLGAIWPFEGDNTWYWLLLPHVNAIPLSVRSENVNHALAFYKLYDSLGDWDTSRELLELASSQLRKSQGEEHRDSIWVSSQLANALHNCGQLHEAERIEKNVLSLRQKNFGRRHPDTISAMSNLAITLHDRGQLEKAENMKREVLALRQEILGQRHIDTISAMGDLAITLHKRGQLDNAEKMKREVLALCEAVLGPRHPKSIEASHHLSLTLYKLNRLDEAAQLLRVVIALRVELLGENHPFTQSSKELLRLVVSMQSLDFWLWGTIHTSFLVLIFLFWWYRGNASG